MTKAETSSAHIAAEAAEAATQAATTAASAAVKAAEVAANAAATAAAVAAEASRAASAAATSNAIVSTNIEFMKKELLIVSVNLKELSHIYVSKEEFDPIRRVVYGLISIIGLAVVGALFKLILVK